jgi:hypothetical protein
VKDDVTKRDFPQGANGIANGVSWVRASPVLSVLVTSVQGEEKEENWRLRHGAQSLPGLSERPPDENLGEMSPIATRGVDVR